MQYLRCLWILPLYTKLIPKKTLNTISNLYCPNETLFYNNNRVAPLLIKSIRLLTETVHKLNETRLNSFCASQLLGTTGMISGSCVGGALSCRFTVQMPIFWTPHSLILRYPAIPHNICFPRSWTLFFRGAPSILQNCICGWSRRSVFQSLQTGNKSFLGYLDYARQQTLCYWCGSSSMRTGNGRFHCQANNFGYFIKITSSYCRYLFCVQVYWKCHLQKFEFSYYS